MPGFQALNPELPNLQPQVLPFMYYRDEANRLVRANTNAAALSERELLRVFNAVKQMRGEVYQVRGCGCGRQLR